MIDPVYRGMNHLGLAGTDEDAGDDDLADVPHRGIQDAADARACRDPQLLGGMAQREGEAKDREGADAEREHRLGIEEPQHERDDRTEDAETIGRFFQH